LIVRRTLASSASTPGNARRAREDALIPGSFEYHRPSDVAEAAALLAHLDSDARVLAGGHSLIPMMRLRMAQPSHLIDLGGCADLKGVRTEGAEIVIGAMTTQHEIIADAALAGAAPILRETALLIADPQVRYLGTIGGNAANGDPGNDMPAVMMALDATYALRSQTGERRVKARDYYHGAYDTAAAPGEILTQIRIAPPPPGHGSAYEKLKRKVGDYATAAAAVVLTVANGRVATCAIGLTNLADRPLLAEAAAAEVIGSALDRAALDRAVAAAEAICEPAEDGRGSVAYRTKMAGVMTRRALTRAFALAQ
jgi:carbon-monoxide dehydrogenase medium subunit